MSKRLRHEYIKEGNMCQALTLRRIMATYKPQEAVDPDWKSTGYATLEEFYKDNYPDKYFSFDQFEYSIDPMETMEDIEKYDKKMQDRETRKCALSFNYFCHKYVKITHPKKGLLPFITYDYQRKAISDYEDNRFCIISKFRQGGLTTVTVLWAMWRCLFKLDETIMVVSRTDREAIASGEIVKRALEELPSWMQPQMSKNNDHQKIFTDTGCKLFFYTPEAARGRSITYLIIDEAAFIPNMAKFWNDIFPTVNTGGNVIVVSTVNGVGNWYEETYHAAQRAENEFHIIDIDYTAHPEYDNVEWVRLIRSQLGEKGFQQEILRDFLGAGDSFIPPNIINDLDLHTREITPIRILFSDWANKLARVKNGAVLEEGALHIWKEPIPGREYIIGVDAAEGIGEEGDNSCFEIIDAATCEQVAEFYSNQVPNHIFAQIVAQVGTTYNNALIIVENEKCGMTVLSKLQFDLAYENLYFADGVKAGIKTTKSSKPMFLETLQTRLLTKSIAVRSPRVVHELKHFMFNKMTNKAETPKGYHDDAIIALCLALFARDTQIRNVPVGAGDIQELQERYKAQVFEDIKKELEKGKMEDWLRDSDEEDTLDIDVDFNLKIKYKRPFNAILSEFGW